MYRQLEYNGRFHFFQTGRKASRRILISAVTLNRIPFLRFLGSWTIAVLILTCDVSAGFNFKRQLFGEPQTLSLNLTSIDPVTGLVCVNGCDTRQPATPFTFEWDDGTSNDGFFPQQHYYGCTDLNRVISVTAYYSDGSTDKAELSVRFVPPSIQPVTLPHEILVDIPKKEITLDNWRMPQYFPSPYLTYFDEPFFDVYSRCSLQYVLSVAAWIEWDMVNHNVFLLNGSFNQAMLRHPGFGGMYTLWFTDPVSFGVGDYALEGNLQFSSFFHEMGHNFTLNTPANFCYGGKIDGCANAVYSETMAQIFQHAAAYEIINNYEYYGLGENLKKEIELSACRSMSIVRNAYEEYRGAQAPFCTWNDPETPHDETFNTFMTAAYMFFLHAEEGNAGYRLPAKRMMDFLQIFDQEMQSMYDPGNNSPDAEAFRATLIATAISYGLKSDLRSEFKDLNFPVDDEIYVYLVQKYGKTPNITTSAGLLDSD